MEYKMKTTEEIREIALKIEELIRPMNINVGDLFNLLEMLCVSTFWMASKEHTYDSKNNLNKIIYYFCEKLKCYGVEKQTNMVN